MPAALRGCGDRVQGQAFGSFAFRFLTFRFRSLRLLLFLVCAFEFQDQAFHGAQGPVVADLGDGSEGAKFGIHSDLFDGVGLVVAFSDGPDGLEVGAGDLERLKEKAGAAWIEGVLCQAVHDLADGLLDGAAVFGHWQDEVGLVGRRKEGVVLDGLGLLWTAGGVVVVAEVLAAEAGAAAAVAVGEDVTALVARDFDVAVVVGHFGLLGCGVLKGKEKARPLGRAFLLSVLLYGVGFN